MKRYHPGSALILFVFLVAHDPITNWSAEYKPATVFFAPSVIVHRPLMVVGVALPPRAADLEGHVVAGTDPDSVSIGQLHVVEPAGITELVTIDIVLVEVLDVTAVVAGVSEAVEVGVRAVRTRGGRAVVA